MTQQLSYRLRHSLYLNITDRCTLECAFCPKTLGSRQVGPYDLKLDHRPTAEEIIAAIDEPRTYDEVVFCGYGEPTLRLPVLLTVARDIKARGGRVRVNTDGLGNLVHKRNILPELAECVDVLSISLNAQNAAVYNRHCQPQLPNAYEALRDFIRLAPAYIAKVVISAIEGLDGVDIEACRQIAGEAGVEFRVRQLDVVG